MAASSVAAQSRYLHCMHFARASKGRREHYRITAYLKYLSAANRARLTTSRRNTPVPALDASFLIDWEGKLFCFSPAD